MSTGKETNSTNMPAKATYSVQEIAEILQIGKNQAYQLCQDAGFRVVRIGRSIRVSKSSFDEWLNQL